MPPSSVRLSGRPPAPLSRLQYLHLDSGLDLPPVDEGGPVGHDFFHRWPSTGKSGDAGWSSQHQRRNFTGKALHRCPVPGANPYPQLHLWGLWIRWAAQAAVRCAGPDKFSEDLLEFESQVRQPLPQNTIGGLGLVVRIRPGVDQRADRLVAIE